MFDVNRPLKTKVPIDGELRTVEVKRFPTDQDFTIYHNTRRVVDINLGRGKTETDVEKATEAAVALYGKIGKEPTSIPPAAAELVVSKMLRAEVISTEPGPPYIVTLRALNLDNLRHHFRMPSAEQVKRFDGITKAIGDGKRAEYRVDIATASLLYGELITATENYEREEVPILHRHVAVAGLMKAVRDEMETEGEDFF